MNNVFRTVIWVVMMGIVFPQPIFAMSMSAWPSLDVTGIDITAGILAVDAGFEPSGISWDESRASFIVVDDGHNVAEIHADGTLVNFWNGGYNFEGVAIPNHTGDIAYFADENNNMIREFNLATGTMTGTAWNIGTYIYQSNGLGLEALEWIPDGVHGFGVTPMGGVFYAGWQLDGNIYAFEPETNGAVTVLGALITSPDYTDLSGLDYEPETNSVFAVFDSSDAIQEYSPLGGDETADYAMPVSSQEGIAVVADCSTNTAAITIADDGGHVITYNGYPIVCPVQVVDADGDGVLSTNDCNDGDSSISTAVTYFQDADGDGYGSLIASISLCTSTAPVGYVTNSSDLYDTARIEISGDGVDNDGDAFVDEYNTLAGNGAHPLYGLENPKTTTNVIFYSIHLGALNVTYRDQSRYRYFIFGQGSVQCVVSPVSATYYALASCDGKYAIVNTLNSSIVARKAFPRRAQAMLWAVPIVAAL